jgi:hypothetical protein
MREKALDLFLYATRGFEKVHPINYSTQLSIQQRRLMQKINSQLCAQPTFPIFKA